MILSHDVNNKTISEEIWELISNREAIEVNQDYVGDSGGPFLQSNETIYLFESPEDPTPLPIPRYQLLSKQLRNGRVAVLLMNSDDVAVELFLPFEAIPGTEYKATGKASSPMVYHVRDVWSHSDLGVFSQEWSTTVAPHDSAFVILDAASQVL